jgi:glycosyltransferase involved in cell wall biosynthesis
MPATSAPSLTIDAPVVSIVTACYNTAQFIEETMESVLAQDYPRIEYIVMDGGSTDETVDILARYESRFPPHIKYSWISQKDNGAADAVNRGFARSSGDIFAYLHADDILLPGAISAAVRAFEENPSADVVYGGAFWIDEEGARIGPYPTRDFDRDLLAQECFICQPASFLRRSAFENTGGLDPAIQCAFDYELWMRLARANGQKNSFHRIDRDVALSRMYLPNKTLGLRHKAFHETFRILKRHYGYIPFTYIYAYLCFRADGRDQFFEPFQPSAWRYLQSLPFGLVMNRAAIFKYLSEWSRVMSWSGLVRRISAKGV